MMARIELPIASALSAPVTARPAHGANGNGRLGAAVTRSRDAYAGVPILQQPTWGHEIAAYFYLGGISSGAATLGALCTLIGGPKRRRLARTAYAVAFGALLPCPALLISDLGIPSRFHHMLRIFKPSSPMNFGAWVLTVHGGALTLMMMRALAEDRTVPVAGGLIRLLPEGVLAAVGLPPALALGGYTGVLIGTTSVPLWFTSPLPGALFMAGALSTGVAATSLAGALSGRAGPAERRLLAGMGRTLGVAELALLGGYLAGTGESAKPLLRGQYAPMLAGVVAASTAALGLAEAERRAPEGGKQRGILAAVLTLLGGALVRWCIVLAGRASARDREGTLAAMAPSRQAPGWQPARRHGLAGS